MPKNLSKNIERKIEKAKPDVEKKDLSEPEIEKPDQDKELAIEKEPVDIEKDGEKKKPLEKIGEALPSRKKKKVKSSPLSSDVKRQKKIDSILSDGLDEVFLNMDSKQQKEFQEEGEKTVKKINKLLETTKVKVGKVINLIKKWLKMIPKVNSYFLEQEAKIKADKIIKLKK